jgi:hypothetical protein
VASDDPDRRIAFLVEATKVFTGAKAPVDEHLPDNHVDVAYFLTVSSGCRSWTSVG